MNLKLIRNQQNYTQKEIADFLGCSQVAYSRYEVESREPSINVLIRLADFYGVTLDELIGRTTVQIKSIHRNTPPNIRKGFMFKECRENANITQKEAARTLGVSIQSVSNWENGTRRPSLEQLVKIADLYNVPTDELLNYTTVQAEIIHGDSSSQKSARLKFSKLLKELREKETLTQGKMAEDLNVPIRTYGSWERCERQPDFEMLVKIADYFDVTADYLLGRTDTNIQFVQREFPPKDADHMDRVLDSGNPLGCSNNLEDRMRAIVIEELKKRGL